MNKLLISLGLLAAGALLYSAATKLTEKQGEVVEETTEETEEVAKESMMVKAVKFAVSHREEISTLTSLVGLSVAAVKLFNELKKGKNIAAELKSYEEVKRLLNEISMKLDYIPKHKIDYRECYGEA